MIIATTLAITAIKESDETHTSEVWEDKIVPTFFTSVLSPPIY